MDRWHGGLHKISYPSVREDWWRHTCRLWTLETNGLRRNATLLSVMCSWWWILANPRGHWPLGQIQQVFPSPYGKVRVARVRTGGKDYVRPITKMCPLERYFQICMQMRKLRILRKIVKIAKHWKARENKFPTRVAILKCYYDQIFIPWIFWFIT